MNRTPFFLLSALLLGGCSSSYFGGPGWSAHSGDGSAPNRLGWSAPNASHDDVATDDGVTPSFVWSGSICYVAAPRIPSTAPIERVLKRPERTGRVVVGEATTGRPMTAWQGFASARLSDEPEPETQVIVIPEEFVEIEVNTPDVVDLAMIPAVCDGAVDAELVGRIQQSLTEQGYYDGPIDGRFGPLTRASVEIYKRASNLYGEGVTIETLERLGIAADLDAASIVDAGILEP